jgi:hypothetical protein
MKALIKLGQIVQVSKKPFKAHPDYIWMDCPDDCTTEWSYSDGLFAKPEPVIEPKDHGKLQQEKINALWAFCDSGDKSEIEEIKKREANL